MAVTAENRYAPPQASVSDVAPPSTRLVLAGRWRRLFGSIVDGIVLTPLNWFILLLLGHNIFKPAPGASWGTFAVTSLATFGIYLVINGWTLATRGQSLGKMAVGTRIVRPDGAKVGLARITWRVLLQFVPGFVPLAGGIYALVDLLLIFRESRRCLHDSIADTIVICA